MVRQVNSVNELKKYKDYNSSRFPSNYEGNTSELSENLEEMFLMNICIILCLACSNHTLLQYCINHCEGFRG